MPSDILSVKLSDLKESDAAVYCDNRLALLDNITGVQHSPEIVRMDMVIAALCMKGSSTVYINDKSHTIHEGDMIICHPNIILSRSSISLDAQIRCICMSKEYLGQLAHIPGSHWDAYMFIEQNPVLHLTRDEIKLYCYYYDLLLMKLTMPPIKHHKELIDSLLMAFLYEFHDSLERFVQIRPISYTSSERLFKDFMDTLTNAFPKKRMVKFYADKLNVTPKYLSSVCKAVSDKTASDIINSYVTKDIETMLKISNKSIKEIANELDFENISFFGKYVKRNLGMSPKQYREQTSAKGGDEK